MKNFLKDGSLIGERNAAIEFFCLVGLLHPNLPFGLSRLLAFAAVDVLDFTWISEFVNRFFSFSFSPLYSNKKAQLFYKELAGEKISIESILFRNVIIIMQSIG